METNEPDPYTPPPSENPFAAPVQPDSVHSAVTQAEIEAEAKRLMRQKHSTTTAWQLFATGIIGCFAPVLAIYGTIFLIRRPEPFPLRRLAVAGVILHWIWTVVFIVSMFARRL